MGADDKAGIATLIEAIDVCLENAIPLPPLEILLTICEEQGLLGAKHFDFNRVKSSRAYVLDAGDVPGSIVVQSPSQNFIEYTVRGKAAHAGIQPENGINAIQIMAQALVKMENGRIDPETTPNFGTIEGGQARNIVADYCRVDGEARSLDRSKLDSLTERLRATFLTVVGEQGGVGEVKVEVLYPECALDAEEPVVVLAQEAARRAGLESRLVKTGGGSDYASVINGRVFAAPI